MEEHREGLKLNAKDKLPFCDRCAEGNIKSRRLNREYMDDTDVKT